MNALEDLADLLACLDACTVLQDNAVGTDWQQRIDSGQPALPDGEFPVDAAAKLLDLLLQREGRTTKVALPSRSIVAAYLAGHASVWEMSGISSERGTLYAHLACQHALAGLAKHIGASVRFDNWSGNICPICGGSPGFAFLAAPDGHRMLVCSACLTEWRYRRIGCCFCDESIPANLQSLSSNALPGWSVSACLTCKGYLKTADLRQLSKKPNWRQEALASLPLDYAVQAIQSVTAS